MSGQPGQNSIFLTLLWCCSSSLTAEGGHRVTWETPALWRCHRSRPGRDRTVFKSKEENSEQSVTHRTHCPDSKCRGYPELQICGEGARYKNTSEHLWDPQTFLSEEDEKPQQQPCAFPGKEQDEPWQQCHSPPATGMAHQNFPAGWNPQPSHPGAVGVQQNMRKEGVGAQ